MAEDYKYTTIVIAIIVVLAVIFKACETEDDGSPAVAADPVPVHTVVEQTASEPSEEELTAAAIEESRNENLYKIQRFDEMFTNNERFHTADDIMLHVNDMNEALGKAQYMINNFSNDSATYAAAVKLRDKLKKHQARDFPILRKKWVDVLLRDVMREYGVRVSVVGKGNRQLRFVVDDATMSNDMIQEIYSDIFFKLRFKRTVYWYYDEYEAWNIGSLGDSEMKIRYR
jgi:hypothetical protein